MAQRGDFLHRFLDVVLAKRRLPGIKGRLHCFSREGFGNGQKCDGIVSPACGLASGVDAGLHGL